MAGLAQSIIGSMAGNAVISSLVNQSNGITSHDIAVGIITGKR